MAAPEELPGVECNFYSILDDEELAECFAHFPCYNNEAPLDSYVNFPTDNIHNPLDLKWIQQHQFEDQGLNSTQKTNSKQYVTIIIDELPMICYRRDKLVPENEWRICIPTSLLNDMIQWHHILLAHCGATRLYDLIRNMFYHLYLSEIQTARKSS